MIGRAPPRPTHRYGKDTHVLPPGFMKIRHFGFLANPCKADNLNRIRQQLG